MNKEKEKTLEQDETQTSTKEQAKKTRKVSVTYTLTALKSTIDKLKDSGLITDEEKNIMLKIRTNALMKWIN